MELIIEKTDEPQGVGLKCSTCDCTVWKVQSKGKRGYMIVCIECGEKWIITDYSTIRE